MLAGFSVACRICTAPSTFYFSYSYQGGVGGRVDSAFDSCLVVKGSNPAEAGYCITTVGKLFTATVPSGAEGRVNPVSYTHLTLPTILRV